MFFLRVLGLCNIDSFLNYSFKVNLMYLIFITKSTIIQLLSMRFDQWKVLIAKHFGSIFFWISRVIL